MKRETDHFHYSIDQQDSLYRGFYQMDQLTVTHQRFDGGQQTISRELMDRHDAVCVLLVDFSRHAVVLIEQFRVGTLQDSNPWQIELVAGLIDKDEAPEAVARREAMEEAGVDIGRVHSISRYWPSSGGSNERIHLFVGEVDSLLASGVHGLAEEGEDIRVLSVPFAEAYAWVRDGTLNNAAAIIALQWLQLNEASLCDRWA
ncbi:NUDIX domain-containing protein [Reinekea sp.]|jgi:ADP-ribose pyrophosphatase|uniref:NUDIX domain-containing protein n=1 Tax=Reinekea sp. TaxID=1970455 RepID=UPI002A82F809|nr:NUDIX domain-containing protein [Reinekea sp.]